MRDFAWIVSAFRRSTAFWETEISHAETRYDHNISLMVAPALVREKEISDHAFFCLFFFQFEDFVKSSFDKLVQLRLDNSDEVGRAVWRYVKGQRPDFLGKVRILMPNNDAAYNRVKELYGKRNRIAHEAALGVSVDMTAVPADLETISDIIHSALSDPEAAP